jgi:hypothetical protein
MRSSSTLAFWMTNCDVADRAQTVVRGLRQVVVDLDRRRQGAVVLVVAEPVVVVGGEAVVRDDVDRVEPLDLEQCSQIRSEDGDARDGKERPWAGPS